MAAQSMVNTDDPRNEPPHPGAINVSGR
jgi:hypothetical protein